MQDDDGHSSCAMPYLNIVTRLHRNNEERILPNSCAVLPGSKLPDNFLIIGGSFLCNGTVFESKLPGVLSLLVASHRWRI